MTPSPDLIEELRASRPAAPADLRARVREIAAGEAASPAPLAKLRWRIPARRFTLVALPAAVALALTTAGVLGLARSDAPTNEAIEEQLAGGKATGLDTDETSRAAMPAPNADAPTSAQPLDTFAAGAADPTVTQSAIAPDTGRAQRVDAMMTLEVDGSDDVSASAQKALDITERLGGHVVSASVATGEGANAAITLRVPVARVQDAVVQLSALGEIVSQQVSLQDLQADVDAFERRQRSLRNQIAVIVARLEGSLDLETRARLEQRLKNLRADLRGTRLSERNVRALGRMATIQLAVVTPESQGGVAPQSRLDRTLEEALGILVWEAVIALAIAIVAAPFALVALAMWLGRRFYRRREEDRLLAT